jgi:hypothetical protein
VEVCEDLIWKAISDRGESAVENTSTVEERIGARSGGVVHLKAFAEPAWNPIQSEFGSVADQMANAKTGEQLHSPDEPGEI